MERLCGGRFTFATGEVRHAGRAIIYRGVVILDAQGNRGAESLTIMTRRDPLSFLGIADKSALDEHRRDFHVAQNMKAGMFHAPVKGAKPRQNCRVNRSRERDVLAILRVAGLARHVRRRDVMFGGEIGSHAFRRERVSFPRPRRPPRS